MTKTKYIVISAIIAAILALFLSACGSSTKPSDAQADADQLAKPSEITLQAGTVLSVNELLYYSAEDPSSIEPGRCFSIGDDGGINVVSATSGEVLESHGGEGEFSQVDDEKWDSLFSGGLTVDISAYSNKLQYQISDSYRLYFMDDEVWLGTFSDNRLSSLAKMGQS